MVITIQGRTEWSYSRNPNTGVFVAVCEPLGLTAQADNFGELREVIAEIQNYLFVDLLKRGRFDAFLQEHGWKAPLQLPIQAKEPIRVEIPTELLLERNKNHAVSLTG